MVSPHHNSHLHGQKPEMNYSGYLMSSVNGNNPDFFQGSGSFFVFVNNSLLAISNKGGW